MLKGVPLAASGLRSVRFCKEVPFIDCVISNDLDPVAVDLIRKNAQMNNVEQKLKPVNHDAIQLMHSSSGFETRFHVIDIDPYGTASPFLDASINAMQENGLLCVTSTDMAVLCGTSAGTSLGKYGGLAVKCSPVHEQAIRLLLHAIQSAASRHGKVIDPLLSLSIDFYARVYVRLRSSPKEVKRIATKTAIMFSCPGCKSIHLQSLGKENAIGSECSICDSKLVISGPLYCGSLHDRKFISDLIEQINTNEEILSEFKDYPLAEGVCDDFTRTDLGSKTKLLGLLHLALEELEEAPFYVNPDHLAATIKTSLPKTELLKSALINAGYQVSDTHFQRSCFKTTAPWDFIWHVMRTIHRTR
ncbi:RNA methyltransferase tRNA(m5U54)methyltransferase, partial [Cichlidogyrus casuarinus]